MVGIPPLSPPFSQAPEIRRYYRRLRRDLSDDDQQHHAQRLNQRVQEFIGFRSQLNISAYLSFQGEISLNPWIKQNIKRQRIWLPKLYEPIEPRLRFARLDEHTDWAVDRFGIREPKGHWGHTVTAHRMDVMLIPLVAFDRQGHRMGMGGGYYDRSMAFRRYRRAWQRPVLVGIAHSLQEHPALPQNPWDAPLDVIITEREIIRP